MDGLSKNKRLRTGAVLGTVLLAAVVVFYFAHPEFYLNVSYKTGSGERVSGNLYTQIAAVILLAAAGTAALWVPCRLSGRLRKLYAVLGFLMTGGVMIFVLEYGNIRKHRTPWQVVQALGLKKLFLTWTAVFLIAAWFAVLVNRWQAASVLTSVLVCVFGVVCYFVYALRGVPLLASDLTTLQTAANVAGEYDYRLDSHTLVMILATISWCDVVLWAGKTRIFQGWKARSAALILIAVLTLLTDRVYFHTDFLRRRGIAVNTFRPVKSYGSNGAVLTFLRSIQMMMVEEPEGYSPERVMEIEKACPAEDPQAGSFQPNLIFIMDEAFTDMQSFMEFETDREVCPFFTNLTENTIRGRLYVSSYGGRTANTEYEVLTGDSMLFMPPSSTPYQLYIKDPMPNLDAALENQGYRRTVGMHPYKPSGYNRRNVYELFGFDRLLFLDEFGKDAGTVFGRVSDDADIDRIIAEYEEAKAQDASPFFLFNVTMQNHSPYLRGEDSLAAFEEPVHVVSGTGDYNDADIYLSEIHLSDRALEKLVRYFEKTDDPTVVVFFGDHQPMLQDPFYEMAAGGTMSEMGTEELMRFYHSNYLIWANFDIEEKEMDLSANYLAPVVKQAAGMELTGYDRFLLDLREELPIVSLNGCRDKNGVYYNNLEDLEKKAPEAGGRLRDYGMLVYNHLFDEKNRTDGFFGGSVDAGDTGQGLAGSGFGG